MNEDSGTPSRSRRFTSFFISDILSNRFATNETQDRTSVETALLETNGCQEVSIKQSSKDSAKQKSSEQDNGVCFSNTKALSSQEDEGSASDLRSRSPFLTEQREALEKIFQESKYISSYKRKQLAEELKLTERQIKTWFQNRRTKFRKIRGSDGLRRKDALSAEHGGVSRVLTNIDGGKNGLSKDWVLTLYRLLSSS